MADISTIEFLQALYGEPVRPGLLLVWTFSRLSGKKQSYWVNNLDEAARQVQRFRSSRDVYFGVALQDPKRAKRITRRRRPRVRMRSVRGAEDAAVALPALFADLGAAGMPADRHEALQLLGDVQPRASIVVDSGGGYHAYWLLRELWLLETDEDRERAKSLLCRLRGALRAAARARGWSVAVAADLARALRLPGTFNRKTTPPVLVSVERFPEVGGPGGDLRYDVADFDALPEAVADVEAAEHLPAPGPRAGSPPADFRAMYEGCPFLRHCYTDRRRLPEGEWRLGLKLAFESAWGGHDGRRLGHTLSADHPGYTPRATDEELDLLQDAPDPTCRDVDRATRGATCRGCPSLGRIETPLDLGRGSGGAALARAHTAAAADAALELAAAAETGVAGGTAGAGVRIVVSTREHEVTDQALAALAAGEANLYQRAGALVHVIRPRSAEDSAGPLSAAGDAAGPCRLAPGSPVVRLLPGPRARELLTRHCAFLSPEGAEVHPPRWIVRALLSRGSWPQIPTLAGVVECPVLRPDGSVLQAPGYDSASGLVLASPGQLEPVPEAPTARQVSAARALLEDAVCNFPFKTPAHRAAWVASLLTPLARAAFEGPSPLNLIDANVSGTGKTLLADVVSLLLTGRTAPRMSYPGNEGELRKAITGVALEATQMVLLDNVSGVFGSPTLDRALTATTWRDRLLGSSEQVAVPLRMVWFATGNNVVLAGDTSRRCLHIRLQSSFERPEKRAGFAHPRLVAWLRGERPLLLSAALTLLRAYVAAGRPDQGLESWGSYESWSDLIRGCVAWVGLPDPAKTRVELEAAADSESGVVHDLVHGLAALLAKTGGAATAKEIVDRLARAPAGRYTLLRSALAELFPRLAAGELPTSLQLAGPLRSYRGRVVRGACIDQESQSYKGVRWAVRRLAGEQELEEGASHVR